MLPTGPDLLSDHSCVTQPMNLYRKSSLAAKPAHLPGKFLGVKHGIKACDGSSTLSQSLLIVAVSSAARVCAW